MDLGYDLQGFFRDSFIMMIAWFLMATSFFIWGRFFSKILCLKLSGKKGIISNIWLGWIFCIFFYAIYNLFFPINAFASIIFYLPGIIIFSIKYLLKLPNLIKSLGLLKITVILLTLFVAATVSIQLPMNFDTGLYHFNNIRWANEHHIIKGLGNLHTRLGFNQLFFLYSASLNFHPYLNDYAFHCANSFLYALFCVGMILGGTITDLLLLCLFFFLPMPYFWINNPTPDMASTLVQLMVFRFIIEAIYYKQENKENLFVLIAIFSSITITLKLSNSVFAIGIVLLSLFSLNKNTEQKIDKKVLKPLFSFILSYFIVWILRGYIQTGYPLFPSTIGHINFDWSVPAETANILQKRIYAYARLNNYDYNSPLLNNYAWIPSWLKESFFCSDYDFSDDWLVNIHSIILMIFFPMTTIYWGLGSLTLSILSLILFLIWLFKLPFNIAIWKKSSMIFYLFLVEIASILFWFFVAPNPRFANGIFIILFITCLFLIKHAFPELKLTSPNHVFSKRLKYCLLFYPFIIFIACFLCDYSSNEFFFRGIYVLTKPRMKVLTTYSGLKVLIPYEGEQSWDSELPSTPEPNEKLALRGLTLDNGFCIRDIEE